MLVNVLRVWETIVCLFKLVSSVNDRNVQNKKPD